MDRPFTNSELRERAFRRVLESKADYRSEYDAIRSIWAQPGITSPESLRKCSGRPRSTAGCGRARDHQGDRGEIRELKKQLAELRRANEILKSAPAFFIAELDRPSRY